MIPCIVSLILHICTQWMHWKVFYFLCNSSKLKILHTFYTCAHFCTPPHTLAHLHIKHFCTHFFTNFHKQSYTVLHTFEHLPTQNFCTHFFTILQTFILFFAHFTLICTLANIWHLRTIMHAFIHFFRTLSSVQKCVKNVCKIKYMKVCNWAKWLE